ncbi:hypothetical protein HPB49_010871 [Dermacentor silvarum]|uniref:Uncharacterized protein n=1 Tax=Dermacentor silvarum TaxID=543639 RepID=A0ACB8CQX7_DERSI|nr:hypothetical protein HPB49_010871 [Dermacentor silvarum]
MNNRFFKPSKARSFMLQESGCEPQLIPSSKKLLQWIIDCRNAYLPLSGPLIMAQEVGKLYQVDLLGAVHIITHVWENTPPQVIGKCFRHSGFVRPEHGAVADDGVDEVSAEFTNDDCPTFDAVLPTDVTLQDYILTKSHARRCSRGLIVPHEKSREALLILEDVCLSSSDSLRAVGHLEEFRKIVIYLRAIQEFRRQARCIIYLDETWVNAGHTKESVWQDKTEGISRCFREGPDNRIGCGLGQRGQFDPCTCWEQRNRFCSRSC